MNNFNHKHIHALPDHDVTNDGLPAYWKRAHHDWRFWVGLFFMLAAISIYFMSDDLANLPHG